MDPDTEMALGNDAFPATRRSVVVAAASDDPVTKRAALETLVSLYWRPIYKYVRLKWRANNEDAKDLSQAFLAHAMEKDFIARYDPAKSRFRTYLRVCLDGFVSNERKSATRLKRGGDRFVLDFDAAERELGVQPSSVGEPEEFFNREWLRTLLALAVDDLSRECEREGKSIHFRVFERYDLDGCGPVERPRYEDLGEQFRLSVPQVTNYLAYARRRFRALMLDRLRAATGSEEEFREEARRILGRDIP
jgi:RNA polymerase sigma factor (sigma-70 family)